MSADTQAIETIRVARENFARRVVKARTAILHGHNHLPVDAQLALATNVIDEVTHFLEVIDNVLAGV